MSDEARLKVKKLPGINTLILEKLSSKDSVFLTNDKAIAISENNLAWILRFLVLEGYISHKVLEGILEEYHSNM